MRELNHGNSKGKLLIGKVYKNYVPIRAHTIVKS